MKEQQPNITKSSLWLGRPWPHPRDRADMCALLICQAEWEKGADHLYLPAVLGFRSLRSEWSGRPRGCTCKLPAGTSSACRCHPLRSRGHNPEGTGGLDWYDTWREKMRPLQRELIFQTDTKFQFSFQTFSLCSSASHQRRCPYLPLQIQFACLTNCPMLITSWTLLLLYYSRPKLKKENMSKAFYLSFKFFA